MTRQSLRTRQKNKRGNRKNESNDSPEIPDRWKGEGGGASDIPGLPSGHRLIRDLFPSLNNHTLFPSLNNHTNYRVCHKLELM